MTTCLTPAPCNTRQFSYSELSRTFTAEISSTNGLARVWADRLDEGMTVVGATGKHVTFVVSDTHYDTEGELTHWTLRSTDGQFTMVLFND